VSQYFSKYSCYTKLKTSKTFLQILCVLQNIKLNTLFSVIKISLLTAYFFIYRVLKKIHIKYKIYIHIILFFLKFNIIKYFDNFHEIIGYPLNNIINRDI